jgi:hypothetical protein
LVLVLERIFEVEDSPIKWDCKKLATEIVAQSKRKSLPNRSLKITNDKALRDAKRVVKAGISEAELFSQLLTLTRRRMKHRGIRVVKIGEPEWLQVKEIAGLATDFVNEFGLETKQGFLEYIKLGLDAMKAYSLNKFKSLHTSICKRYESIAEIQSDPHSEDTEKLHDLYVAHILNKVGYAPNFKKLPDKYIGFKRAVDQAKELKVSIKTFLRAQFYALEWVSGVPDPLQLYGPLAEQRLIKYAFENNLEIKEKEKVNLKNIRKKRYDNDKG